MTDPFARTRQAFDLPEDIVYLDGNSLGPLQHGVKERMARELAQEWGPKLVRGWTAAGWVDLPIKVGDRIGALIGAQKGTVLAGDSTSINVFKALSSALALAGNRRIVLSDSGNFPTDLYVAQGAIRALGQGHELKTVAPDEVADHIDESVAAVMLTHVDYRTGRLHDMAAITAKARKAGAIMIWDLAHSAGALPVDLSGCKADFAVGCGYKYLNGGPGAPAFIYVRPGLAERIEPALAGWMGHAAPFAFDPDFRSAPGIDRMRVGTPPILSMAALDAALDIWEGVDMTDVRARSIELSELFINEVQTRCPELELASPRDPQARGSQVSFRFEHGYAAMQAVIAQGVIGDFRAPDMMRFGFTPLYVGMDDVLTAAKRIETVMRDRLWDRDDYKTVAKVT